MKPKKLLRGSGLSGKTWLYDEGDHLIYLEGYCKERVLRFYYQDIQTAMWVNHRSAIWGRIFFIVVLGLIGGAFFAGGFPEVGVCFLLAALVILIRIIFVVFKGGYCRFFLVTAAQGREIVGVSTVSKAQKLIHRIESKLATFS